MRIFDFRNFYFKSSVFRHNLNYKTFLRFALTIIIGLADESFELNNKRIY